MLLGRATSSPHCCPSSSGCWAPSTLRTLVEHVQAQLPTGAVPAAGHGVAAGRDVKITASGGGVAAGTVHGNVMPGNPTTPGSGDPVAAPGTTCIPAPGSVTADHGGTAVGLQYQRPAVPSQPVRLMPRPVFLADREDLLAELPA